MKLIIGLILVFASVVAGYLLEGGHLLALYQPAELLIIGGAALGAFIVSNPKEVIRDVFASLPRLFGESPYNKERYMDMLGLMYGFFAKVRKDGAIAIESDVENPEQSALFHEYPMTLADKHATEFICDIFRLTVSGNMNSFEIENLIDIDLECHHETSEKPIAALANAADGLPAFGIVAAVMGVVITMGAISGGMEALGHKVAAALVGTFLGILLSYGLVGPLASSLRHQAEEEASFFACIKTCFIAFLNGYPPQISVEFGRMALLPHVRPEFLELEQYVKDRYKKKKS
jgi:chemotaxis protein MotA